MELFNLKEYKTMDGNLSNKNPVGYCTCYMHEGYITKNMAKTHNCSGKCCKYLIKNDWSRYWKFHDTVVTMKKYKKVLRKKYNKKEISHSEHILLLKNNDINHAVQFLEKYEGEVKIRKEQSKTISNYVPKTIIYPKKPNIVARLKNKIKIEYRKFIKNLKVA